MANSCTYKLPQRCLCLQQFLFQPADNCDGPSPNTVITPQSSSLLDMSLGEFKALCTIPLGVEIQWQNILLQLVMPSADFKVETSIFILQVVNQAGPQMDGSALRKAHDVLDNDRFANTMLDQIRDSSEQFKENWEFVHGLRTLIFLTMQILSLSSSAEVHDLCLSCLSHLCNIALRWANQVTEKASCTIDDKHRNAFLA